MRHLSLLALLLLAATTAFAGSGRIVIVNMDPPKIGLNDPTPVDPVGGNPGRTLGEQRMHVYQAAADRWSAVLDTNVNILAQASFASMECTADGAILGGARAQTWKRNSPNAPLADTWYPVALANSLAGVDLEPGQNDIVMQFNSDLDKPTCMGDFGWYYGLDANHGNDTDLFVVVLHEVAHGLGVSAASGTEVFVANFPSVFDIHTMDATTGQRWNQMTQQQRARSLTDTGNLVWDGEHVRDYVARYLEPVTTLTITAPSAIARNYDIGTASFGPVARTAAMTGKIIRALDAAVTDNGPTTFDGCTPFTNAAAITGNVALIDRGSCTFVQKARNAQSAGAVGVVIVDNTGSNCSPPGMGGDATDVTIPVVSISTKDGDLVKGQLTANAVVSTMLRVDPSQLAGTSQQGYMRLYAPCEFEGGSTKHHWDTVSTPNLLMEPAVNGDVLHGLDLTLYQLLDMGWREAPRTGRTVLRR